MEMTGQCIVQSCTESPELSRINLGEREYETHHSSNYQSIFPNPIDGLSTVTQNDDMRITNIDKNEELAKTEKGFTHDTEETDIELSPPMSLEEMNCGRISPIQAEDIYPVNDGFDKRALGQQINMGANGNDLQEKLKLSPSDCLMKYPAKKILCSQSSCYHGQSTSHTILRKCQNYTAHWQDDSATMNFADSSKSNIIFNTNVSLEMTTKDYRELAEQNSSSFISQNKSTTSNTFSNYFSEYIAGPEKIGGQSMMHFLQNRADVSNQIRATRSDRIILNDRVMHTAIGEGVTLNRSAIAGGDRLSGLSWRMEKEKIADGQYVKQFFYQGESAIKMDSMSQGLWDNVKKVHLPDSSSYVKSFEGQEPKFRSVLFNPTENLECGNLQKNASYQFYPTSNLSSSKNVSMMEKVISKSWAAVESNQVITTPSIEGSQSQNTLLELPSKKQDVRSNSQTFEPATDKGSECNSWDNEEYMIQMSRNKQEIHKKEFMDDIKIRTGREFITKGNLQFSLPEILENAVEELHLPAVKEIQHFEKENWTETKDHDIRSPGKKIIEVSEDLDCGHGKTRGSVKSTVGMEPSISQKKDKEMEDGDEIGISEEESRFRKEIDMLVDDIIEKRETKLLLEENLCVIGTGKNFNKSSMENIGEHMKTNDEVCLMKGVMDKNVQSPLILKVNNDINSGKQAEVLQMGLPEMMEIECEEIRGHNKDAIEIQMMNTEAPEIFTINGVIVTPVENDKNNCTENEVKNFVTGTHSDKLETFEDDVNKQLLRDVDFNFTEDEINRKKSQTMSAYIQAEDKEKDDVSRTNNLDNNCASLEDSLFTVPFTGKYLDVEKNDMKNGNNFVETKEKEIFAGICTSEKEAREEISEGGNASNLLVVRVEGNTIIDSGGRTEENRPTTDSMANVETDFKETTSLMDGIIKKWDNNNLGDGAEIDEGNLSKMSHNSRNMENDEEVDEKDLTRLGGKDVSTIGKTDCCEKESFISFIHKIGDEYVASKGENTCDCTLEKHSFCDTVGIFNTRPKNIMGDGEDASHNGISSEETINTINKTICECKDAILKVTDIEILENGSYTPKSEVEDKNFDNQDNSMGVQGIALADCLGGEDCSANENFECNIKTNLFLAQITSLLPNDHDISKSMNVSEVKNEECVDAALSSLPVSHQSDVLCVEICKLEENNGGENKIPCHGSSTDGLCDMKGDLSTNCDHEDNKNFEINDRVQLEKYVLDEHLNSKAKCMLNESIELEKTTTAEVSEEVVKNEGRWCASQKRKDYMISGIEVTRSYSRDNLECLSSGNEIVRSLEIDSSGENSLNAIKDMAENLKLPGEFLSMEFGEMEKSAHLEQNSILLDESNGDCRLDLNNVPDMKSFGKENYEKLEFNNTFKNRPTLRTGSPLRDIAILNGFSMFSFPEGTNFDIDGVEKQNNIACEEPAYSEYLCTSLSNDCNEDKYVLSLLKHGTPHHDFDTGDSFSKPPNFPNLNESTVDDEMCDSNSGMSNHLREKVLKSLLNDESEKTDFKHQNVVDLICNKPLGCDIFAVHEEVNANAIKRGSPNHVVHEFDRTLVIEETNGDHQIVPDKTDTLNSKELELDCVPSEKRELFGKAIGKTKSESNSNIINIVDTERDSFSLDSYLETTVDQLLSPEAKKESMSSTTCHECYQFANASCQTQLCGLLNTIHSCECLETHLLTGAKLQLLKFSGRKRSLQALNLELLDFRDKKIKMIDEAISIDILSNNILVKNDVSSKVECTISPQPQTTDNHETELITENIVNDFGNKGSSKDSTSFLKLPEDVLEDLDEGLDEGMWRKELVDQKVPVVECHQDSLAGLEGKSQKMNDIKQESNPKSFPLYPNIYHGSKALRLGLSKRAKLHHLHHRK